MKLSLKTLLPIALACVAVAACTSEEDGSDDADPPELIADVGSEEHYTVGEDVVLIHLTATDPQDMELEFDVVDPPQRASFSTFENQAVFRWDPIHSDVTDGDPRELVFSVTNEAGKSAERVVHVHIDAGQTGTRFVTSSSQLYNITSQQPLEFDVEVESDTAPLVVLDMPEDGAPEGAHFEQQGDFRGTFQWLPSSDQREQSSHEIVFTADDEEDILEHRVTVVMHDPDATSPSDPDHSTGSQCAFDDAIDHEPLGPQRSAQPYPVKGQLVGNDDFETVHLYWTTDDPLAEDPHYQSDILDVDGGSFAGEIPNPLLESGHSKVVSYTICAFTEGQEGESTICAPDEYFYQFVAYSPDDDHCLDDGVDLSDPDDADTISTTYWNSYRVCDDAPNYHSYDVADGESLEIAVSHSALAEPRIDVVVDDGPVEVDEMPCIGLTTADIEGPASVEVRVVADDFPYHITGFSSGGQCPDEGAHTNPDDALWISDDFALFDEQFICTEDDRDVYAFELVRGDHFDAHMWFDHDEGDLDMTLFAPSQLDDVTDDGFGVAQGWSTDDDESIAHEAEESGLYFLSVITSSQPNQYELMTERRCEVDDEFAGNHSFFDAATIEVDEPGQMQSHDGLKLCENQPDYYRLTHDGEGDITWLVEIEVDYGSADSVDVRVLDELGFDVDVEQEVVDNRIDVTITPDPGDELDVRIESDEAVIYDLVVLEFDF